MSDTFSELHERFADSGDVVGAIVDDLKLSVRARHYLAPLIVAECERLERQIVRQVEIAHWRSARSGKPATIAADRSALLGTTFALGDGKPPVRWGEATADQHRQRAEMLERIASGTFATANRHREAAAEIESAGVSCLNDLAAGAA